MSRITALLSQRDNSQNLVVPPVRLQTLRYSWTAMGGPEQAELKLTGANLDVWEAAEWLRCPVTLYDERADAVWWGYVSEVEVSAGAVRATVSLDDCYNRVKVGYIRDTNSGRAYTDWVSDTDSIAAYGTIEYLGGMSSASDGLAAEDADKILARHRYPLPVIEVEGEYNPPEGRLTCRGWYHTLGWRYYSSTTTTDAAATDIVSGIISSHSQFIGGCDVDSAGTITRNQYYELERTCRDVIDDLLGVGVDGGNRLLATVTHGRRLRVYEEPSSSAGDLWLSTRGQVLNAYGQPYPAERCPAGCWIRLGDNVPYSLNASRLADMSRMFVERSEYEPATGRLRLEPRGRPNPWDLVQVED